MGARHLVFVIAALGIGCAGRPGPAPDPARNPDERITAWACSCDCTECTLFGDAVTCDSDVGIALIPIGPMVVCGTESDAQFQCLGPNNFDPICPDRQAMEDRIFISGQAFLCDQNVVFRPLGPGEISTDENCPTNSARELWSRNRAFVSTIDPGESSVTAVAQILIDDEPIIDEQVASPSEGQVFFEVSPWPCETLEGCSISLTGGYLVVTDMTVAGITVGNVVAVLDGTITRPLNTSGGFTIPANVLTLQVRGDIFGFHASGVLTPDAEIHGSVDFSARTLSFSVALHDDQFVEIDLTISLVAAIDNFPPVALFDVPAVAECSHEGIADVALNSIRSTDLDANITSRKFLSVISGEPAQLLARGETAVVALPLGDHEVRLDVLDAYGARSSVSQTIDVVDTSPPELTDFAYTGPVCLWPPNHDYVILKVGEEFTGMVADTCDPAAELRVTAATSNQPDNARGDGDTSNDVVVFPGHVCLRVERQGTALEGRQYRVNLHAVDASGNASDPVVDIVVGHNQRLGQRCLDAAEYVAEDDPRCNPSLVPQPAESPEDEAGDAQVESCAAAGKVAPLIVALFAAVPRRRRVVLSR